MLSCSQFKYSVFELFHLRYLAFSCPIKISAAVSNLQNLQTSIQERNTEQHLVSYILLPSEIWRLPQLRHLVSFYFSTLWIASSLLQNLQIFQQWKIWYALKASWKWFRIWRNWESSTSGIKTITSRILYIWINLKIKGLVRYRRKISHVFPGTLKKLTLSCWELPWEDMTIVGSFKCSN